MGYLEAAINGPKSINLLVDINICSAYLKGESRKTKDYPATDSLGRMC